VTMECNIFYYLINNCVEFRPEENLLYSRENGERITLFFAASRCLQLLLNQQGKLVSQQELFDIGWNRNGGSVSNNTFYQNILMLRKGLKLVGCEQTVIKTVPRKGLTIPLSVAVEKIEGNPPPLPIEEEGKALEEDNTLSPPQVNSKKESRIITPWWMTTLSVFACLGMLLFVVWHSSSQDAPLTNYNYVGRIDQCEVYLYNRGTSLSTYQQFITQNKVDCSEQNFVYFTIHPILPRASVIRCQHPFAYGEKNQCFTEYQLEWKAVE
jgi:DNA-binding winged helix-turn-helix (wHTH) protein